ncbi:MAG: CHAT domain-containing protein [Desulfobacterales bacterium]
MEKLREVKLELLRAGPLHNQLLSPLTPYLALCGNGGPVTFHIPMEHRELLNRLERLRYFYLDPQTNRTVRLDDRTREAEMEELGRFVGNLLAHVKTLGSELSQSALEQGQGVHLRLVLSGSELSLIPFELANSPLGLPGEGLPLVLQKHLPITITREARRKPPRDLQWNRPPRLLFISAAPGVSSVPTEDHRRAIRQALGPWIRWDANPAKHQAHESELLTVVENASLALIRERCIADPYTHVHILAHGSHYQKAGEHRYGLALCQENDANQMDIVSGERLAQALRPSPSKGCACCNPTVVTLMTCDGGNQASVLIPGGSIAHELHAYGIPWVLASQFPLTISGSNMITREFYKAIFRGDDPRSILSALRGMLRANSEENHDWASLVAYGTVPDDFDLKLAEFRDRQRRKAIDIAFNKAEKIAVLRADNGSSTDSDRQGAVRAELDRAIGTVCCHTADWERELPAADSNENRKLWSEYFGMRGAIEKRIALLHFKQDDRKRGRAKLEKALGYYRRALDIDFANHWTATQCISLGLVLDHLPVEEDWFVVARWGAERDRRSRFIKDQAWAHGTLAELEMLSAASFSDLDTGVITEKVTGHCGKMMQLAGEHSFHVYSTRRQFKRYLTYWKRNEWHPIAQAAFDALGGEMDEGLFDLPPDP